MPEQTNWKQETCRLRARLLEDLKNAEDISHWVGHRIEREAGIWESDCNELEAEMWRRFAFLETNQDCTTEDRSLPRKRIPAAFFRRFHKLYRTLTGPFSRTAIDQRRQFNLDQQNRFNRESIPFVLATVLSLQKTKDRLNRLEEMLYKLQKEQEEISREARRTTKIENDKPNR